MKHFPKYGTIFVLLLLHIETLIAQPTVQDCQGAIAVCSVEYNNSTPYLGAGNVPNEINTQISCIGAPETNSVWYTFTVQTSGLLSFTIFPNNPTNDYDWALFNLTNASCSDIFHNPALEVGCNFSPVPGPTGMNNLGGPQNESPIFVNAGETFVLYISIFNFNNQGGYRLDFSQSTAQIVDDLPPDLLSVNTPIECGANTITVNFTENVQCADVIPSLFNLIGPNGNIPIIGVISSDCNSGASYSSTFVLTLGTPLFENGDLTLSLAASVSDLCGNTSSAASSVPISFSLNALVIDSIQVQNTECSFNNGNAQVFVSGGVPPYVFAWSPNISNNNSISNVGEGWYNFTVSDQDDCILQDSVFIDRNVKFSFEVIASADTCSKGVGTAQVIINGTTDPYLIEWNNLPPTEFTSITGLFAGNNTVTVTDIELCDVTQNFDVPLILNDSIMAFFENTPEVVEMLFPFAKFVNLSENFTTWEWRYLDTIVYELNPQLEFPDVPGSYPVTLEVFDINGCSDSYTREIVVFTEFHIFAPTAFTPNDDGTNDYFEVFGIGIKEETFNMKIFDRWGHKLIEFNEYGQKWDGTVNGFDQAPTGTYLYIIEVRDLRNLKREVRGSFLLYR